ncbi:hypothetical protein [uncultured Pseudomonas sp.]|uniref:hypothetical protein n=1 Tax=uncultured Pseudomonas sp. TaxID=114707 RepID=UPI0025D64A00|nr:hypothetical protein [uncultured Pseudomonas sp.]
MTTNDNAHQPLIEALQAIVQHYASPDLSHEEYRVKACQQAEEALAQYRDTQLNQQQPQYRWPGRGPQMTYFSTPSSDEWFWQQYPIQYSYQTEFIQEKPESHSDPRGDLRQKVIDEALTSMRLRRHCWQLETDRDHLLAAIRDALRLLETIMASLRGTLSLQALDAIEAFLNIHAMTIVRIHLTAPANSRSETN